MPENNRGTRRDERGALMAPVAGAQVTGPAAPAGPRERLFEVDALRLLAACAVLGYH